MAARKRRAGAGNARRRSRLADIRKFHNNRNMESKQLIQVLSALAQESRLAVYRLLVQAGPEGLSAGRIAELAHIPPSSLSFHLKELSHAGLVSSRQESRFVIYSANYPTMNAVLGYLA